MKTTTINIKLVLFVLTLLWVSACGSTPENPSGNNTDTTETKAEANKVKRVGDVVEGYLKIKDALVASDKVEAKEYAVASLEVVDAIAMPEIQQAIKEIAGTDDIEAQRESFKSFSTSLYKNLKDPKNISIEEPLYKLYCPMAFDNQGAYWLSAQQEILNPYFGDRMLKCGRVEEELTANN